MHVRFDVSDQKVQLRKEFLLKQIMAIIAGKEDVQIDEFQIIPETRPIWKKRRYQNVVLAFWAFIMVHSLRTNLSVAIVSMSEEVGVSDG